MLVCGATQGARADATLAVGPSLGGITGLDLVGAVGLDLAWRRPHRDWWIRAETVVGGTSAIDEGSGHIYELRAGLEHRRRDCGSGCIYYGVDVALVRGETQDAPDDTQLTAVFAVPRAGIDVGGTRVRFRLGVEAPLGVGREHDVRPLQVMPIDTTTTTFARGFAVSAALVVVVD